MSFNADDEILNDFLVEAGEILDQLSELLIDLEQKPQDKELLNAVFRGFHTIKGDASFLSLDSLVSICHVAEDVFNILRQGERVADAALMDVVLQSHDQLNRMFAELRSGTEPTGAPQELIDALSSYAAGKNIVAKSAPSQPESKEDKADSAVPQSKSDTPTTVNITDQEYKQLLESISVDTNASQSLAAIRPEAPPHGSDEITEDEFEMILDKLHGPGRHSGVPNATPPAPADRKPAVSATSGSENISEEEFESLLDQLHGKGKFNSGKTEAVKASPPPQVAATQLPERSGKTEKQPAAAKSDKSDAAPAANKEGATDTTVRVDTKRLDDIMNLVGELVLVRNRLATLEATHADEEIGKAVANLDVVTADLQTAVMKTRMQPIKKVFGRFPRVVRDLARNLNKEVELVLRGEDTDLDKNLVEALADPLVHLVRNAVDHGIEPPDVREAAGKPRMGTVELAASQEGDHILLTITDDGGGMDADLLRSIAVKKGLFEEEVAARLDVKECFNLIFMPGFSTKTEISDVSGRGVGMDVVKTRIVQLNGSVEIDSVKGQGSSILIKVPLTLAIMPTLMVKLDKQIFALPLANVSEIFHLDLTKTNIVDGQKVVVIREKSLPLFYLAEWLVPKRAAVQQGYGHVVVVQIGSQKVGFVVDQLIGQEEVVIKPLGTMLQATTQGLSGATIRGDGKIALILDMPGLIKKYARKA
ncbi:MAG: chemotaxis protein CheA [Gammaproteobacteria bacterium RBG_16_57_12]|nr:MAG: chemotaxis protein CheA [Gammaproteobacteria bacterium RBG_16_57_12]